LYHEFSNAPLQNELHVSRSLLHAKHQGGQLRTCLSCGARAVDEARFCSQCAAPLDEAARSSSGRERRQVTVFFSELSGFGLVIGSFWQRSRSSP